MASSRRRCAATRAGQARLARPRPVRHRHGWGPVGEDAASSIVAEGRYIFDLGNDWCGIGGGWLGDYGGGGGGARRGGGAGGGGSGGRGGGGGAGGQPVLHERDRPAARQVPGYALLAHRGQDLVRARP